MKTAIRELVEFTLSDALNSHKSIVIGRVNKKQAEIIRQETGIELLGCERLLDTSGIRHILRKHGSKKTEENRGQIVITIEDFVNIPNYIDQASAFEYIGKNKLKRNAFQYTTENKEIIIIIEGIVINKKGNKIVIETMFKKSKATTI